MQALIRRWGDGEIDERFVHEDAEALWEADGPWPELPESDPRAIGIEVLATLDILNHSLLARADVPALAAFLRTPLGAEVEGWAAWNEYLDTIDFDARERGEALLPTSPHLPAAEQLTDADTFWQGVPEAGIVLATQA